MNPPSDSRQLFLRYLLDELPPDERAEVDEALIVDQEASDAFQEARYDLIDAYAANELPPEDRKRVEQAVFTARDGQEALSMALAMQGGKTAPEKKGATWLTASDRSKAAVQVRGRNARIVFFLSTLAACLLLAFVFLHLRQRPMRQMVQTPPTTSSTTAGSAVPEKSGPAQLAVPPKNSPSTSHSALRQAGVLAVAMPMGTVRGVGVIPIHLHPGIQQIEVQWPVPSDSTASAYTLEIASGQSSIAVLPQHGSLTSFGDIRVAEFLLPADTLPNGQSIFRLRAADASSNQPVAESSVRISR
ncbi:MAG: magnesium and cobalt transport protein CorA [Acidobacteriaceae bacterium]